MLRSEGNGGQGTTMHPVNSFDVFDTLIARRCVQPRRVLDELERRAGMPGLADARLAADRALGALGRPYQLPDIWRQVARVTGLDPAAARRLLDLEVQLEHEQVIPVVENLALVRDGDLLVSDTYLPPEVVLSLLRKAGLGRVVGLVATNDGKFSGRVWPRILEKVRIREHLGDNPHSDGRTPSEAGIRAVIYTGAGLTPVEQFLVQAGHEALALLAREARLANPFPPSDPHRRHLWNLSCQLNFPLLFLASLWLGQSVQRAGAAELFFVSRDCLLWRTLFQRLFPGFRTTYLFASRLCLLRPTESYLEYFRSAWHPGGLVVDLASTGTSWARLFARLGRRGRCRLVAWADDSAYLPSDGLDPTDWLDVEAVFRNSDAGPAMGKGLEMINYAPHGSVEDVVMLPCGSALPVLGRLEYDPALPQAAHDAFAACLAALEHHPGLARAGGEAPPGLIRALAGLLGADRGLAAAYPGHHQADLTYQRRLLS